MSMATINHFFSGTLRWRLVALVALVQAVFMTILVADLTRRNEAALRHEQVACATSLAHRLAGSSAVWLAAKDTARLQELVGIQQQFPAHTFSVLLDNQGRTLAHTDRNRLQQVVQDMPEAGANFQIMQNDEGVEVGVPVMLSGDKVGWARVGISRRAATRSLAAMISASVTYIVMAILIGSLLAWRTGNAMAHKIRRIHAGMKAAGNGNLDARVVVSGTDEVDELAEGFNQTLEALRSRYQEMTLLNATLEKRITEQTHQIKCANKELETFAYSISHDLRAPLRAIDGFSTFLEEGYGDKMDDEGRRLITVIRANARKMDRLITDILALSRATQAEINFARVDMQSLVNQVYNEGVSAEVRAQFRFTLESLPEAWGDPILIRQVWANLISNAVKYSMKSPVREIVVGGDLQNNESIYFIKDAGVGFNPEYASKLFGPFQRLHKADEFEGSGIGLALVQRIIHRHGGRVWAQGKENAGATFSFALPVRHEL